MGALAALGAGGGLGTIGTILSIAAPLMGAMMGGKDDKEPAAPEAPKVDDNSIEKAAAEADRLRAARRRAQSQAKSVASITSGDTSTKKTLLGE